MAMGDRGGTPVWDDGSWTPLPAVDRDLSADACVVGLGAAGLTCAAELRARGLSVVGVDGTHVGGGAAGRNGGFLMAGIAAFHHHAVERHGRAAAVAMYLATLAELDRAFDELGALARRTGSLRLAMTPGEEEECERQYAAMAEDGLPVERWAGAEGRGLLMPRDGVFNPLGRCRLLATHVIEAGARLFEGSKVTEVHTNMVRVGAHRVQCDHVFVAVDGGLERVVPALAPRVRSARLQMLATAPLDRMRFDRPTYAREGYEYWQQLPDRRLVLGGFRDRGGEGEWTMESSPSPLVQRELDQFLVHGLGVTAEVTHRWAGSVAYTASGLPIAGEVLRGVWALGAYSGTGNIVGPLLARGLVAWAIDGDRSRVAPFTDMGSQ